MQLRIILCYYAIYSSPAFSSVLYLEMTSGSAMFALFTHSHTWTHVLSFTHASHKRARAHTHTHPRAFTNTELCTNRHRDRQCISTCKHTHTHTHTQLIKLTCWLRRYRALCCMTVIEEGTRAHKVLTYEEHTWTGQDGTKSTWKDLYLFWHCTNMQEYMWNKIHYLSITSAM